MEDRFPPRAARPEAPPLAEVEIMWAKRADRARWPGYLLALVLGGAAVWGATVLGWIG